MAACAPQPIALAFMLCQAPQIQTPIQSQLVPSTSGPRLLRYVINPGFQVLPFFSVKDDLMLTMVPPSIVFLSFLLTAPTFAWITPIRIHHTGVQFDVNSSDPFTFQNVYNSSSASSDIYVANLTLDGKAYEVTSTDFSHCHIFLTFFSSRFNLTREALIYG